MLIVLVMISDLMLRGQDIPGANPAAWDAIGTVTFAINLGFIVGEMFRKDRSGSGTE